MSHNQMVTPNRNKYVPEDVRTSRQQINMHREIQQCKTDRKQHEHAMLHGYLVSIPGWSIQPWVGQTGPTTVLASSARRHAAPAQVGGQHPRWWITPSAAPRSFAGRPGT
jgi:hypothetical protein